jgi:transaldolase
VQADERLPEDSPLRGRIAVANAKLAYADVFLPTHSGAAWERLEAAGANPQRPLWASTGGKNPAYSPTLYIDGLIGEDSVTTVPDATLDAFRDAPDPAPDRFTVLDDVDRARADLAALADAGVDLDEITADLERAGVQQFADAYAEMLEAIARKRQRIAVS